MHDEIEESFGNGTSKYLDTLKSIIFAISYNFTKRIVTCKFLMILKLYKLFPLHKIFWLDFCTNYHKNQIMYTRSSVQKKISFRNLTFCNTHFHIKGNIKTRTYYSNNSLQMFQMANFSVILHSYI